MVTIIKAFFTIEWKFQKWIMRIHKVNKSRAIMDKIYIISWFCFFATIVISMLLGIDSSIVAKVCLTAGGVFITVRFLDLSIKALATVSGFLTTGIIAILLVSLTFFSLISTLDIDKFNHNTDNMYLVFCLSWTLVWCIYSSLCNAEVSTLVNAILTAFLGLITGCKGILWIYVSPFIIGRVSEQFHSQLLLHNYTMEQYFNVAIDITVFPILGAAFLGTVVCVIKRYWIITYNNGNDINRHLTINGENEKFDPFDNADVYITKIIVKN